MRQESPRTAPAHRPSARQVLISVACLLGWFTGVGLTTALVVLTRSDQQPQECGVYCLSDREQALIIAVLFGVPSTLVGLLVAVVALPFVNRRFQSGLVSGSVAALAGLILGPILWLWLSWE